MSRPNYRHTGIRYRAIRQHQETGILAKTEKGMATKGRFQGLLRSLPRMQDSGQRRAGRNIAVFFLLMLALTLIARGTAAATLAKVNIARVASGEIVEAVKATGIVSAGNTAGLTPPENLTVLEVPAQAGAAVVPGDQLVKLDPEEVNEAMQRAQAKQKEYEQKLVQLSQEAAADNTQLENAQNSLLWARQDLETVKTENTNSIAAAQKKVDTAKAELTTAQDNLTQLETRQAAATPAPAVAQEASNAGAETGSQTDEPAQAAPASEAPATTPAEELAAAKQAVTQAKDAVSNAEAALAAANQQADQALTNAQRAVVNAEQALKGAETGASTAAQDEEAKKKENEIAAETVKLDIKNQEKQIAALQKLVDTGGWLVAEQEGILRSLPSPGDKTSGGMLLTYAETTAGLSAEITVSKKDAQSIQTGAQADIVDSTGSIYFNEPMEGTVTAVGEPDTQEQVKITISLPEKDWTAGQSVEIRIVQKKETYQTCIALSAVRSDSAGDFLLVIEDRSTILGQEIVLVKVPVTILSKGDDACAVEGALSPNARIVTDSTKPVAEGDKVRVVQE